MSINHPAKTINERDSQFNPQNRLEDIFEQRLTSEIIKQGRLKFRTLN
jgi:hypothetical protein